MLKLLLATLLSALPGIGAQVFIEPGQAPGQVDSWFSAMEQSHMHSCRIRMFESHMLQEDGTWDFGLYDYAFKCAQAHGVGVWATLFPNAGPADLGGRKFPYDNRQEEAFFTYVKALVSHFRDHPALKGWVLINEPGVSELTYTPYVSAKREAWEADHPREEYTDGGYLNLLPPREARFLMDLNTGFLGRIAAEIRKWDPGHDLHVNPHAVFHNYDQYDFPAYRAFLTSFGGSAHPSWHFGFFDREEYTLAMLAQSEMLRSGAGGLPWFMTEIQGGNNTYSGGRPLCPTPEEIRQWLWSIIGCEGKGGIFWTLNPRVVGKEAGEWALLDYQEKPSERMVAAGEVASVLEDRPEVFASLSERSSGIDILYFRESAWAEGLLVREKNILEGRRDGSVIKSVLACFFALTQRGMNVGIKEFDEYNFSGQDYSGRTIILSQQIAIPRRSIWALNRFVNLGGTLIVEGLSGFFDEKMQSVAATGSPLAALAGTDLAEYVHGSELFSLSFDGKKLPVHLWKGRFADSDETVKICPVGSGKVVWAPSCIALGAWVSRDFKPLSDFLASHSEVLPGNIGFGRYRKGLALRTLDSPEGTVVICVNKSGKTARLRFRGLKGKPELLYSDHSQKGLFSWRLNSEGTLVLHYPHS